MASPSQSREKEVLRSFVDFQFLSNCASNTGQLGSHLSPQTFERVNVLDTGFHGGAPKVQGSIFNRQPVNRATATGPAASRCPVESTVARLRHPAEGRPPVPAVEAV